MSTQTASANVIIPSYVPGMTLADMERETIIFVLWSWEYNRTYTARDLGISIRSLRDKIQVYESQGYVIPKNPRKGYGRKAA